MRPRRRSLLPLALALLASTSLVGSQVSAAPDLIVSKGFRKAMTLAGVREHQAAFQAIADANGGNRVGGSVAYDKSVEYVIDRMEAAGYDVSTHAFQFLFNADATPPTLRQESPTPTTYIDGTDFSSMTGSGSIASTTASVWAIDLVLPAAPAAGATTSGCEAADFTSMPAGSIALMQRGTCPFGLKADNARAAGAIASVIFNDGGGGTPDRTGNINGTLGAGAHGPAVGTTLALGQDLANGISSGSTGSVVTIRIDRVEEVRTTHNVIAETPGGDPNRVVVVGAHLDSVPRGPGINDNGSGSATILEIAEVFAAQERDPRNKLRFMWYGAEEFNLLGSQAYVTSLSQAERDKIMAMVNFDMVGSPNYVRFVYDGDNSAFPVGPGAAAGPPGSAYLETLFTEYFNAVGPGERRDTVQRPLGLRAVHRSRDPGRRSVHRCRRHQDGGPGSHLRRHRRGAVRPVLPPGVRHVRQQLEPGARRDVRCRGARHPDVVAGQGRRPSDRRRQRAPDVRQPRLRRAGPRGGDPRRSIDRSTSSRDGERASTGGPLFLVRPPEVRVGARAVSTQRPLRERNTPARAHPDLAHALTRATAAG